ncbi:hypothetical protein L6R46_10090 [Myxococcota bacterium]|nr:hypothetical protein [Myxococcota bacterium]
MVNVVEEAVYEERGGREQAAVARWEALTALAERARAARVRSDEGLRALEERVDAAAGRRLSAARSGRDALEEGAWGVAAEARRLGEAARASAARLGRLDAVDGLVAQAAGRVGALARGRKAALSRAAWAAEAEVGRVWAQVTLARRAVDSHARIELQALKGAVEQVFCPGRDHDRGLRSLQSALVAWEARHIEALDQASAPLHIELGLQAALLDGAISTQRREAEADQAAILAGLSAGLRVITPEASPRDQALLSSSDQRAQTDSSSWLSAAWRRCSAWASALGSR